MSDASTAELDIQRTLFLVVPQLILIFRRTVVGITNKNINANANFRVRNRPVPASHSLKSKAKGLYCFPVKLLYSNRVDIRKRKMTLGLNTHLILNMFSINRFSNSKQQIITAYKNKIVIDFCPSDPQISTTNGMLYAAVNQPVR
jgi:hypothetical protein